MILTNNYCVTGPHLWYLVNPLLFTDEEKFPTQYKGNFSVPQYSNMFDSGHFWIRLTEEKTTMVDSLIISLY